MNDPTPARIAVDAAEAPLAVPTFRIRGLGPRIRLQ
jgi:hypothetical protein